MEKINPLVSTQSLGAPAVKPAGDDKLLKQAQEFESVFVSQMLKYSGLEKAISSQSSFGGEAYSSLMLEQYANNIVENGGFGLAEKIYEQLLEREGRSGTDANT